MQWQNAITVIGAHAEGEIGRVITDGLPPIPGNTMRERLIWLNENGDHLRRFALFEPRGAAQMTINVLTPPCMSGADAGFIPMQGDGSHAMSGSNAMCVTTVLLETGLLEIIEPQTRVVLDTAAGLVTAVAACDDGKVKEVSLDFIPSFAEHLDAKVVVPELGEIRIDVAFGGVYYALVDVRQLGVAIVPDAAQQLVALGHQILTAAQETISVCHPQFAEFNTIEFCMFTYIEDAGARRFRNATVMPPGRIDRSPCGTGTAARLAVMHARGDIQVGETHAMRSIIGSQFNAQILGMTEVGGKNAILPKISGRAWIYSRGQYGAHATDPYPEGFTLSDTWGTGIPHVIPA